MLGITQQLNKWKQEIIYRWRIEKMKQSIWINGTVNQAPAPPLSGIPMYSVQVCLWTCGTLLNIHARQCWRVKPDTIPFRGNGLKNPSPLNHTWATTQHETLWLNILKKHRWTLGEDILKYIEENLANVESTCQGRLCRNLFHHHHFLKALTMGDLLAVYQ